MKLPITYSTLATLSTLSNLTPYGGAVKSEDSGRCVTLHVEPGNPARRLYERLEFRDTSAAGMHRQMRWSPAQPKTAS